MSDELKRDYQEKLGEKFGAIFNGVSYDWANGLVRLNEYRALFGDPANIEFINTFSGPFMLDVQQVFWRERWRCARCRAPTPATGTSTSASTAHSSWSWWRARITNYPTATCRAF